MDGENIATIRVTEHVDNSHVRGQILFLSDQEDGKILRAKSFLDSDKVESTIVRERTCVSLQTGAERIEVLLSSRIDEHPPGFRRLELRNASPINKATLLALKSLVTLFVAKSALHRIGRTVASSVALDTTGVAGSGELALDTRVGTVSLVVTDFAAVVALASETATGGLVWTLASEVTGLSAAVQCQFQHHKIQEKENLHATGAISSASARSIASFTIARSIAFVASRSSPRVASVASVGSRSPRITACIVSELRSFGNGEAVHLLSGSAFHDIAVT